MTSNTILLRRTTDEPHTKISTSHALIRIAEAGKPQETSLHPITILFPVAAAMWLVLISWAAFGGGGATLDLAVVTTFGVIYCSLMLILSRNAHPDMLRSIRSRSFRTFVNGPVDIQTGRIDGREALVQVAAVPVALAIGGTVMVLSAVAAGL